MGRLTKNFIRFPHTCTIYEQSEPTPFADGENVEVWSGVCRKESNTNIRTFKGTDSVFKSDYRIQLGNEDGTGAVVEGIKAGMLMDVTDKQGTFSGLMIVDAYAGNLGTSVYCNDIKN